MLNTNIVAAGPLWNGQHRRLPEAATAGQIELWRSAVRLDELALTQGQARVRKRVENFGTNIAAAVAARAERIDAGDRKHLLPIGSQESVSIVTARGVVEWLDARSKT